MRVLLAQPSGACYGVERAIELAREAAKNNKDVPVYTLGQLIHNPIVVHELQEDGAFVANSLDGIENGVVVIRSHGVPKEQMQQAQRSGIAIVDATCPHVSHAQSEASRLAEDGRFVLILGEPGHPEVEAMLSYAGSNACVIEDENQVPNLSSNTPIGVVVQTTQQVEKLQQLVQALEQTYSNIEVSNTICAATRNRQHAATQLADQVDAMIVIGGRNSANTNRLCQICMQRCANTHHIESDVEIDPKWFEGCETVGVTAGASTPRVQIDIVVTALENL